MEVYFVLMIGLVKSSGGYSEYDVQTGVNGFLRALKMHPNMSVLANEKAAIKYIKTQLELKKDVSMQTFLKAAIIILDSGNLDVAVSLINETKDLDFRIFVKKMPLDGHVLS